jgi:SAM-dependent methyltransferase
MPLTLAEFISHFSESNSQQKFIKLTLANYKGEEAGLKNILVKKILIKKNEKFSFTYRYKTRDIVKNYSLDESISLISEQMQYGFKLGTLFTIEADWIIEKKGAEQFKLEKKIPTLKEIPDLNHDKQKLRLITPEKTFLHALNITDAQGNVFKSTQDKYRQINHYVEILSSLLKELPAHEMLKVADMGSGKGYLTFALYDYLTNTLNLNTKIIGVEFRKDLVELCNKIAKTSNFTGLSFVEGSINDYESRGTHVLIALHACDTATDDAIAQGIAANADLIVVAPCCHKQIRREIEKNKTKNELDFLLKYGIFLERQAEMVTDGIRALILEYHGYSTKVFEFISDAHTPKNVLIVAQKGKITPAKQQIILQKITETKAYFGIEKHYLEKSLPS